MKMEETVVEEGEEYLTQEEPKWNYELDIAQLCRICANPNEYLIPIFQGEGLEHELKNKISKHLPIKVSESDRLPTNLCYQCASTLIAWHDMVIGCVEADEKLRALIEDDKNETDDVVERNSDSTTQFSTENNMEMQSVVPERIETISETIAQHVAHQIKLNSTVANEKVVEEITTLEPEFVEEVSSDPRCDEMEEDYNDDENYSEINQNHGNNTQLSDDFVSDLESDEEFSTLYSCSICKASDMLIGEFLMHTKKHTKEEKQLALENLVAFKSTQEEAARNAAIAYGFKVQPSLESSITLYSCTVCGQGNLMLKNLQEHSKFHPQLTDSHFCNLCEQQFHDSSNLASHLETHLDNNDLICQYCNRRFSIIEDLELHESSHYQAEYVCIDCRENFKSKELVVLHLKQFHSTGTTCYICDTVFKTDTLIEKHFMTHASINIIKRIVKCFVCDFCAKKYDSKVSLQRHMLFLHNDRMPFICEHCGFTAYHKDSLKEHLAMEHSNNDTIACFKCGLLFSGKANLDAHMANHTQEKMYNCKLCELRFEHPDNLKYHLTSHGVVDNMDLASNRGKLIKLENELQHAAENDLSLISSRSGETFGAQETYTTHLNLNTTFCDLCEKPFENEILLNVHLNKVHTSTFCKPDLTDGVFPFKCNYCSASFRLEFELEDHSNIHGINFHRCHLCFEEFIIDRDLQEHIITHEQKLFCEKVEITQSSISEDPTTIESDLFTP